MNVSEKKVIAQEYFEHAALIKDRRLSYKKNIELKERQIDELERVKENRKSAIIQHENDRALKKLARQHEVEKHQDFLNLKPALNII